MSAAPTVFALGAVALGVLLASAPGAGARALGPVRAFALSAAIAVVCLHLLPEAGERLGGLALLAFAGGILLPSALERGAALATRAGGRGAERGAALAVEASYAGLLAHHVGDGVALQLFGGAGEPQLDVLLALASHTVPVTALVVLRFAARDGRAAGLARAAGLGAASLAGIVLSASVGAEVWHPLEPWVAAAVSGLLLHFIAHDLEIEAPRTLRARLLDLGALALGVAVTLASSHPHGHGHDAAPSAAAGVRDVARLAPYALLGLIAIAALARPRRRASRKGACGHAHHAGHDQGHSHDHAHGAAHEAAPKPEAVSSRTE